MDHRSTAQRLLDAKDGKEKKKFPYLLVGILVFALVLLGTESDEIIPWGMLFLGLSAGGLMMEIRWRKNGKYFWEQMRHYIDWPKVEEDAKGNSNKSAQVNLCNPPDNPRIT